VLPEKRLWIGNHEMTYQIVHRATYRRFSFIEFIFERKKDDKDVKLLVI